MEHEVHFLYLSFSYNVHVFLFMYLEHLSFNSFKNHHSLWQWFSKSVPTPAASTSPGNLLKTQIFRCTQELLNWELWGWG